MERKLYNPEEVCTFIHQGKILVLAGDEKLLDKLPKGNWIGGTIPYFNDVNGGIFSCDKIFVDDQTNAGLNFKISKYDKKNLSQITADSFNNGFSIAAIPAQSATHIEFALNSLKIPDIFKNPLIGFISGVKLDSIGKQTAKVFQGTTLEKFDDAMIVLHVQLPENKAARVEIINIFEQNTSSDIISFPIDSFVQTECYINGNKQNFVDYLDTVQHDIRFPLITNQGGALINKSFQQVNRETKEVALFAPVFRDEKYILSKNIDDYKTEFNDKLAATCATNYSCNCILNFLYGDFENNKINITGATTFGEIGYLLLNQTLVYLVIEDLK